MGAIGRDRTAGRRAAAGVGAEKASAHARPVARTAAVRRTNIVPGGGLWVPGGACLLFIASVSAVPKALRNSPYIRATRSQIWNSYWIPG